MNPFRIRRRVVWTIVLLVMTGSPADGSSQESPADLGRASAAMQAPASDSPLLKGQYVKKGNRADTIRATLAAFGLPNLEGEWYHIGPFDNTDSAGFDTPYPPEKKFDPTASYLGKGNQKVTWQKLEGFTPGRIFDLIRLYPRQRTNAVAYLYHRFESPLAFRMWCPWAATIH
ncbi:MAG: hypothetical protein KatS3mg107_0768 [Gemmataceae bacterium]|nr:MAG: hypothetical protein KatS3mg107_0768 [Gemmataceae bacterium]